MNYHVSLDLTPLSGFSLGRGFYPSERLGQGNNMFLCKVLQGSITLCFNFVNWQIRNFLLHYRNWFIPIISQVDLFLLGFAPYTYRATLYLLFTSNLPFQTWQKYIGLANHRVLSFFLDDLYLYGFLEKLLLGTPQGSLTDSPFCYQFSPACIKFYP